MDLNRNVSLQGRLALLFGVCLTVAVCVICLAPAAEAYDCAPCESDNELTSIIIRDSSGSLRPAATVGDQIQISICYCAPVYINSLMNNLLPIGLCLGMKLSDARLTELGLTRVIFSKYRYRM